MEFPEKKQKSKERKSRAIKIGIYSGFKKQGMTFMITKMDKGDALEYCRDTFAGRNIKIEE